MALRDQPYFPLYVQDIMTDEKLNECSAATHGIYIKGIMCLMHKSQRYGTIELKAKHKQTESKLKNFALLLAVHLPYNAVEIETALRELIEEKVCYFEGDFLIQKRMLKDGQISEARAVSGSKGGKVGRNSGTKRYYNEPGYLYLIYDADDKECFKVGISKEPDKRILGIIRKCGRKNLKFRRRWEVSDMGEAEQSVLDFYDEIRDGEWIYGSYSIDEMEKDISVITNKYKSKTKAKPEYEYEYETVLKNNEYEEKTPVPFKQPEPPEKLWADPTDPELTMVQEYLLKSPAAGKPAAGMLRGLWDNFKLEFETHFHLSRKDVLIHFCRSLALKDWSKKTANQQSSGTKIIALGKDDLKKAYEQQTRLE